MLHNYKALYQEWEHQTREEGRQEGRQEGREEGGLVTGREILRSLIGARFGAAAVAELEAALLALTTVERMQGLAVTAATADLDTLRHALQNSR